MSDPKLTIIATKGTLDWAYPPFILASTAAALGMEVSIFYTFYGLNLLLKDTAISFSVSVKGKVKGNAGVNNYFGQWEISKDRITSSKMASTKMFGIEPKGIMQQEELFLSTLSTITRWHVDGEELQLFDGNEIVIRLQLF